MMSLVGLGLTSCAKEYGCYCTTTATGEETLVGSMKGYNKSRLDKRCATAGWTGSTCKLK